MSYLYGDSSPSPLKVNFLELLRRALDFSVHVLQSAERIRAEENRLKELKRAADTTLVRLEALAEVSKHSVEGYTQDLTDEHVKSCGGRIIRSIDDCIRRESADISQRLEEERGLADQRGREERAGCLQALGTMLCHADLPETATTLRLEGSEGTGHYTGTLSGTDSLGLAWTIEVEVPENNVFAQLVRVDRFVPQLEIHAPAIGGWLKKELKVRSTHLERMLITGILVEPGCVWLRMRDPSVQPAPGYDVEIRDMQASMRWTGEGAAGEGEPFVPNDDDTTKLLELRDAIVKGTSAIARKRVRLVEATWKGISFDEHKDQTAIVSALIHMMAPATNEISRHSLVPTELVLRRLLGDDRREELFVSKTSLVEKLSPLSPQARSMFDELGLEVQTLHPSVSPTAGTAPSKPPTAQLPGSITRTVIMAPIESVRPQAPAPEPQAASAPQPKAKSVPPPAKAQSNPPSASTPSSSSTAQAGSNGTSEGAKPSPPPPPASEVQVAAARDSASPQGAPKVSTPLVAQIKRIVGLAKAGKADDAYRGYAELFASPMFHECRIEDQRNALKLLVMPKNAPPSRSDALVDAHKSAVGAIKSLVAASGEPADYELLGVCQMMLEDKESASATFKAALAIEKERHPDSQLADALAKRASSI